MRPDANARFPPTTVFSPRSVNGTRDNDGDDDDTSGRAPRSPELAVARTRGEWYHRGGASRIFFFRGRFFSRQIKSGKLRTINT